MNPLGKEELQRLVLSADKTLKDQARFHAQNGRTKCRFQTKHNTKYEFIERLKRVFPGCAVYVDPAWATNLQYGTCYIIVDWS